MIETIQNLVAQKADTAVALAKEIWGYAELSYEETKSAGALIAALKKEGFSIEEGIAGIPTAFTRSSSPMLPGLIRILSTPTSAQASAAL